MEVQITKDSKLSFNCEKCGATLRIPISGAGVTGPCPKCREVITAPDSPKPDPPKKPGPLQRLRKLRSPKKSDAPRKLSPLSRPTSSEPTKETEVPTPEPTSEKEERLVSLKKPVRHRVALDDAAKSLSLSKPTTEPKPESPITEPEVDDGKPQPPVVHLNDESHNRDLFDLKSLSSTKGISDNNENTAPPAWLLDINEPDKEGLEISDEPETFVKPKVVLELEDSAEPEDEVESESSSKLSNLDESSALSKTKPEASDTKDKEAAIASDMEALMDDAFGEGLTRPIKPWTRLQSPTPSDANTFFGLPTDSSEKPPPPKALDKLPIALEPESSDKPEAALEPAPSDEPEAALEPVPSEKPETALEPVPSEKPETVLEPTPSDKPEAVLEPVPSDKPEAAIEPTPSDKPEAAIEPVPSDKPEAVLEPVPSAKPEAVLEPTPSDKSNISSGSDAISKTEVAKDEEKEAAIASDMEALMDDEFGEGLTRPIKPWAKLQPSASAPLSRPPSAGSANTIFGQPTDSNETAPPPIEALGKLPKPSGAIKFENIEASSQPKSFFDLRDTDDSENSPEKTQEKPSPSKSETFDEVDLDMLAASLLSAEELDDEPTFSTIGGPVFETEELEESALSIAEDLPTEGDLGGHGTVSPAPIGLEITSDEPEVSTEEKSDEPASIEEVSDKLLGATSISTAPSEGIDPALSAEDNDTPSADLKVEPRPVEEAPDETVSIKKVSDELLGATSISTVPSEDIDPKVSADDNDTPSADLKAEPLPVEEAPDEKTVSIKKVSDELLGATSISTAPSEDIDPKVSADDDDTPSADLKAKPLPVEEAPDEKTVSIKKVSDEPLEATSISTAPSEDIDPEVSADDNDTPSADREAEPLPAEEASDETASMPSSIYFDMDDLPELPAVEDDEIGSAAIDPMSPKIETGPVIQRTRVPWQDELPPVTRTAPVKIRPASLPNNESPGNGDETIELERPQSFFTTNTEKAAEPSSKEKLPTIKDPTPANLTLIQLEQPDSGKATTETTSTESTVEEIEKPVSAFTEAIQAIAKDSEEYDSFFNKETESSSVKPFEASQPAPDLDDEVKTELEIESGSVDETTAANALEPPLTTIPYIPISDNTEMVDARGSQEETAQGLTKERQTRKTRIAPLGNDIPNSPSETQREIEQKNKRESYSPTGLLSEDNLVGEELSAADALGLTPITSEPPSETTASGEFIRSSQLAETTKPAWWKPAVIGVASILVLSLIALGAVMWTGDGSDAEPSAISGTGGGPISEIETSQTSIVPEKIDIPKSINTQQDATENKPVTQPSAQPVVMTNDGAPLEMPQIPEFDPANANIPPKPVDQKTAQLTDATPNSAGSLKAQEKADDVVRLPDPFAMMNPPDPEMLKAIMEKKKAEAQAAIENSTPPSSPTNDSKSIANEEPSDVPLLNPIRPYPTDLTPNALNSSLIISDDSFTEQITSSNEISTPMVPTNQSSGTGGLLEKPREILDQFLAATTWEERIPLIYNGESRREEIGDYYSNRPVPVFDLPDVEFSSLGVDPDTKKDYYVYDVRTREDPVFLPVVIRVSPDGPRIDWDAFKEFKDKTFTELADNKTNGPASYRLQIERSSYFGQPDGDSFKTKDDYICFQISPPYPEYQRYAFVPKGTKLADEMQEICYWGMDPELLGIFTLERQRFPHGVDHLVITRIDGIGLIAPASGDYRHQ